MANKSKSFILIMVDDDHDDFFLFQEAFRALDSENQLRHLSNGEELWEYLNRAGSYMEDQEWAIPSLILLDLNIPRIDGREILAKIKSDSRFMKVPVIIYTTSNNPEDKKICIELGARSYVIKPDSFAMIKKFSKYIFNCLLDCEKD